MYMGVCLSVCVFCVRVSGVCVYVRWSVCVSVFLCFYVVDVVRVKR